MISRTGSAQRILGILKKVSGVENWTPNEKGWHSLARGGLGQVPHEMRLVGADEKARIERMFISPYVEEPLNSKVIKSFVPELRSRYVFFEFRDSYVLSLWTFDVRYTHSHIMAMCETLQNRSLSICVHSEYVPIDMQFYRICPHWYAVLQNRSPRTCSYRSPLAKRLSS